MKTRSESEPRLRQVYTSRIKDGRISNEGEAMRNNFMTQRKLSGVANPEFNGSPVKKQCHHNKPIYIPNKSQLKIDNAQTEAYSPVKRIADFQPPKILKYKDRKQQTYNGRKLQYPHASHRRPGHHQQQKQQSYKNDQPRMQRAQSAQLTSSRHFVDRSVKSRQRRQKHAIDEDKVRVAVNYLMQTNGDYLAERARICSQKARPKDEIFKIDLAKTPSTYKQHYPPKQAKYQIYMEPQNQKTALSLGPRKVCGNSTNNQVHNGVQGPRADLSTWPEGFRLQGPLDGTTTYGNKFPDYGDYDKMVPIAVFNQHPMGMPFTTISTKSDHFRGQHYPKADLATWNNLHPYGNEFDPNRNTTYKSMHNSKEKQPIQQWPMYDPRLIISKGKFSTQYKSEMKKLNQHELNHENYCQCKWHEGRKGRKKIYN